MLGKIGNRLGRAHRGRKHSVLKVNNDHCDVNGLAERLAVFGMLDTYEYMDNYSGREEEYMPDIPHDSKSYLVQPSSSALCRNSSMLPIAASAPAGSVSREGYLGCRPPSFERYTAGGCWRSASPTVWPRTRG